MFNICEFHYYTLERKKIEKEKLNHRPLTNLIKNVLFKKYH